jgi:hypothetical protein
MRTKTLLHRARKAGATPTTLEREALAQGKAAVELQAAVEGDGREVDGKFPESGRSVARHRGTRSARC